MPIPMPPESSLPAGTLRELVQALHGIYRDAGKPSARRISAAVRKRSDLPDTVSHEAVGMMLKGSTLVRWAKLESVVRLLSEWSVTADHDVDAVVRRFHGLWLQASDAPGPQSLRSPTAPAAPLLVDLRSPEPTRLPEPARSLASPAPFGMPLGFVDSESLGTPPGGVVAERRRSISLPERQEAFTGRVEALRDLERALEDLRGSPVVLVGQGGVGKTQLALEFAHRRAEAYEVVWWLRAEQPETLLADFRSLAGSLRVPVQRDAARTAAAVVDRLEARRERWLLIFDNVEDAQMLLRHAPSAGGAVLVTSRDPDVAAAGHALSVDVFSRAESVAYLRRRDAALDEADAGRVAERLGDLPLALAQVAALHATTGMSLPRYLDVFEGHLAELLAQGRPAHDGTTLAALVGLAVAELEAQAPVAALLMEVLAQLDPERVPLTLLRSGVRGPVSPPLARGLADRDHAERLATDLARHGLVTLHREAGWVSMHRLVAECVRRTLEPEALERGRVNAHALLTGADPGSPDNARSWEMYGLLVPHVTPSGLLEATEDEARRLVVHCVRYLHQTGDYEASRRLAGAAKERWSEDSQEAGAGDWPLQISRHLANALRARAEYRAARELTADTLERLRASPSYGPDHELTLQLAFSAGYDLRLTGEYSAARTLDEDTLARCLRIYGPGHRHTLTAENNVAVCQRLFGEPGEAYRHDVDVLAGRSALGEHDVLAQLSAINVAWDLHGLGRYGEMSRQVAQAWASLERRLASTHAVSLLARRAQVVALHAGGLWTQAAAFSQEIYADHVRHLGVESERTLFMGITRINALRTIERLPAARDLAVETQETFRRTLGWQHPGTASASIALAAVLRAVRQVDDARRVDEQAHRDLSAAFGPGHPFVVCAANGLAGDLVLDGVAHAAVPLLAETVDAAAHTMDPQHPVLLASRANLATARGLDRGGDPADRLGAAAALRQVVGDGHPHAVLAERGEWVELDVEPPPA